MLRSLKTLNTCPWASDLSSLVLFVHLKIEGAGLKDLWMNFDVSVKPLKLCMKFIVHEYILFSFWEEDVQLLP